MRRIIVFDCDGTLVDSAAMILAAMDRAFDAAGLARPPHCAVRRVIGLSLDEAFRSLAPSETPDAVAGLVDHYRKVFAALREENLYDEPLFEGIDRLLEELDEDGRLLAIATGKSRRGVDHLIAKHRLERLFVSVQTADLNPSKPHPAMLLRAVAEAGGTPSETAMIGDTSYDMEMAVAAGALPLGVAWGHHDAAYLRATGAAAVAEDSAELRALLFP